MDFGTAITLWWGCVAVALTVTPRVVNRWAAAIAWLITALYAIWLFGSRPEEARAFFAQHPSLSLVGAGGLLLIGLLAVRERQKEAARVAAQEEADRQRTFDSFPVDLGIVDHGVNVAAIETVMRLMHEGRPAASRIIEHLFVALPKKFPEKGDPDHAVKKQTLFREAAVFLREDVVLLESVAERAEPESVKFMEACRAILRLPVMSTGDAQTLGDLKSTWERAAVPFQQVAVLLRDNSDKIDRLSGNQQDLTRIVVRTTTALRRLATISDGLHQFFVSEAVPTITQKLERK